METGVVFGLFQLTCEEKEKHTWRNYVYTNLLITIKKKNIKYFSRINKHEFGIINI